MIDRFIPGKMYRYTGGMLAAKTVGGGEHHGILNDERWIVLAVAPLRHYDDYFTLKVLNEDGVMYFIDAGVNYAIRVL